jgi:hypothetical protein
LLNQFVFVEIPKFGHLTFGCEPNDFDSEHEDAAEDVERVERVHLACKELDAIP